MPPDAARGRSFRNICGMSPPASGQVTITPPALGQTQYRAPRLAKSFFHPSEPSLIIAVDAVRDDQPAEEYAREIIAYHTNPDGSSNAPMRTANAHIDLGIVLARHGELDEAVDHGLQASQFERKTEASLLSRAADLDHDLMQRYPRDRVIEPFHERYADERRTLRSRTIRDDEL